MARVLVVDDEKLIVKGIRFSLEQDGMEVDCAYDGEEAIELAKKTEYDIVLLDVMLPKYDGYEVCQAIREFSDMPIIMLTAKGATWIRFWGWSTAPMIISASPSTYWRSRPESRPSYEEAGRANVRSGRRRNPA